MNDKRYLRFNKTREAQKQELQEDYVEMIASLIIEKGEARSADLAAAFGVSQAAVNGAIARLKKNGLVRSDPYRAIFLTDKGQTLADRCTKRHELVVSFLLSLGVSSSNAEQDAEGLEHYLSEESLSCLKKFIKNNSN